MNTIKLTFSQIIKRKKLLLLFIIFISGINLFGWLSGKMGLTSFSINYIPIPHSSAVIFIALSFLLLIDIDFKKTGITRYLLTFSIIFIAFYCCLIFLDFLFDFTWDAENIFIKNPGKFGNVLTGRMSPITSFLFVMICTGILGIRQKKTDIIRYIGGTFSLIACTASFVLLIGYLYRAPILYGSNIIPVSMPSAISFLLLSITLIRSVELKYWTFNLIKDNKVKRQLLKSFLPIVIFIVILEGYLDTVLSFNDINPPLTAALILLMVVFVTVFIVFRVSSIIGAQLLKAEQALKESETKFREIINQINDGITVYNEQGEIVVWNKGAEKITGLTADNAVNKNMEVVQYQYATPQSKEKHHPEYPLSTVVTFQTPEVLNQIIDEEIVPVNSLKISNIQSIVFPIKFSEYILYCKVFRDITEVKQYEKQLLQSNVDKDRFISILSHDLRSPFTVILGYSELLLENIRIYNIDQIESFLKDIYHSTQMTFTLLEDLLKWVRVQSGKITFEPKRLSFKNIYNEIFKIYSPLAQSKKISINNNVSDEISVFADSDMLKVILRNLISNALKFTANNGIININAIENSGNVTVSVADTGIGIKPESLTKLFDISQLHTTRDLAGEKGSGLGLVLCKEFVEKHGGKIWVESIVGKRK